MTQASSLPLEQRIAQIRDIALAQLKSPQSGFAVNALEDELRILAPNKKDKQVPDVMEAWILLSIVAGKRPRRAQKPLYHLFRTCIESGEMERYNTMEKNLKDAEKRGVSLEGVHFPQAFGSQDQPAIWAKVEAMLAKLEGVGGEAFLCCGTLLGVVRDKALIAHDDDIDLAYVLDASTAQEAAEQWKKAHEFLVSHDLVQDLGPNPCSYKLNSGTDYNIDLFPAWVSEGKVHVYPYVYGQLSESDVFPLQRCTTTGLPIPRDPEAMLAVSYGEGWRVPDPAFSISWGKLNRRFAPFRDRLE